MKRLFPIFILISLMLAACSSEPSDSSVKTESAETQSAKPTNTAKPTGTPLPSATHTLEPTATVEPTATPITYSISGQVFFDLNGTGQLEEELGEKQVVGAKVCVGKKNGDFCALSDKDGFYQVDGLQTGEQKLYVLTEEIDYSNLEDLFRTVIKDDVENKVHPEFRVLSIGKGWEKREAYKFKEVEVPAWRVPLNEIEDLKLPTILEVLSSDLHLDLGLMEGELTNIYTCEDLELLPIRQYFDVDGRDGHTKAYKGEVAEAKGKTKLKILAKVKEAVYDGHSGFDQGSLSYNVIGLWVLSPVPGQLSNFTLDHKQDNSSLNKLVKIFFGEFTFEVNSQVYKDYNRLLQLAHNKDFVVKAGSEVERYQPVGMIGMTGKTYFPHIHLEVRPEGTSAPGSPSADVFRDLYTRNSGGYWTKDNDPICIPAKYLDPEQWPDSK